MATTTHDDTPQLDGGSFVPVDFGVVSQARHSSHAPRILLLYGSVRKRSFSRLVTHEAARILRRFGAETRIFDLGGCRCQTTSKHRIPRWRNCVTS